MGAGCYLSPSFLRPFGSSDVLVSLLLLPNSVHCILHLLSAKAQRPETSRSVQLETIAARTGIGIVLP